MFNWLSIQKTNTLIDIKETIVQYLSEIRITIYYFSCLETFFYARHTGVKTNTFLR